MSEPVWIDKDLGPVDAYALAVAGGYEGTKQQWIAEIAGASTNASNTEAYAKGTRGGEAVASDDPAYHNNAKYYNEQAALEKASAQAAAETASAAYNVNLLAANYDATKTYAVGDHVIYSGGYYRCNTAITTAEAWTAAHWTQLTLGDEAADLKSALSNYYDEIPYNIKDRDGIIQGGSDTHGNVTTDANTLRNTHVLFIPKGAYIQLKPGDTYCKQVSFFQFDSGMNRIQDYGWKTELKYYIVNVDSYFVFLARTASGVAIVPSNYDAIITIASPLTHYYSDNDAMKVFEDGTIEVGDLCNGKYIYGGNPPTVGGEGTSASYSATAFIDISNFSKIILYFESAGNHDYNAFYTDAFVGISSFRTVSGYNEITVPSTAKYVRISETPSNMATLKIYVPEIYHLQKQIDENNDGVNGKIGDLTKLPTPHKNNIVASITDTFGSQIETNTITGYETNSGALVYDNSWYQYNNSNYKHAVIPITNKRTVVKITAGTNACFIGALKSYTKPTSSSHDNPTFSDYWVRRVEIPAGKYFEGLIPQDANYLIVNTLYNNVSCVSQFELDETIYGESVTVLQMTSNLHDVSISAHNVRDFSEGSGDGCPDDLVSTNLPLWKAFVSDWENTDFLVMDEWFPYFDRSHTINAYNEIFKQFFPYKFELPETNPVRIVLSKHPGIFMNLNDIVPVGFGLPTIVCQMDGKTCAVVCWLQSNADTPETRIAAYENAITALAQYDLAIVAGDFNTEQGLEELETWTDAGYTLGNGGYWGEIKTWDDQTPNDNIVTKGFIYKKFEAGEYVTSDHKAVRAFLSFNN